MATSTVGSNFVVALCLTRETAWSAGYRLSPSIFSATAR
jgi:hypothetical protein